MIQDSIDNITLTALAAAKAAMRSGRGVQMLLVVLCSVLWLSLLVYFTSRDTGSFGTSDESVVLSSKDDLGRNLRAGRQLTGDTDTCLFIKFKTSTVTSTDTTFVNTKIVTETLVSISTILETVVSSYVDTKIVPTTLTEIITQVIPPTTVTDVVTKILPPTTISDVVTKILPPSTETVTDTATETESKTIRKTLAFTTTFPAVTSVLTTTFTETLIPSTITSTIEKSPSTATTTLIKDASTVTSTFYGIPSTTTVTRRLPGSTTTLIKTGEMVTETQTISITFTAVQSPVTKTVTRGASTITSTKTLRIRPSILVSTFTQTPSIIISTVTGSPEIVISRVATTTTVTRTITSIPSVIMSSFSKTASTITNLVTSIISTVTSSITKSVTVTSVITTTLPSLITYDVSTNLPKTQETVTVTITSELTPNMIGQTKYTGTFCLSDDRSRDKPESTILTMGNDREVKKLPGPTSRSSIIVETPIKTDSTDELTHIHPTSTRPKTNIETGTDTVTAKPTITGITQETQQLTTTFTKISTKSITIFTETVSTITKIPCNCTGGLMENTKATTSTSYIMQVPSLLKTVIVTENPIILPVSTTTIIKFSTITENPIYRPISTTTITRTPLITTITRTPPISTITWTPPVLTITWTQPVSTITLTQTVTPHESTSMEIFTEKEKFPKVSISSQDFANNGFSTDIWDNPTYGTTLTNIWDNSIYLTTPSNIWDDPILPSLVSDKQSNRFPIPPMVPYIFWPKFHQASSGFLYSYRTIH